MSQSDLSGENSVVTHRPIEGEESAWRHGMLAWIEQYTDAIDTVEDHVYDAQMAKQSVSELEELHRVLQVEGIQGLRASTKALELRKLHRVLMEEGMQGLREATKAAARAKKAAAKARARTGPVDVAKLAQIAFVPSAGAALQEAAQALRTEPAVLCARLAAWRSSAEDREPSGDIEAKDAIESFVDSVFTVYTLDNASYRPFGETERKGVGTMVSTSEGDGMGEGDGMAWLAAGGRALARLAEWSVVHRGPLSGGHLKVLPIPPHQHQYQHRLPRSASHVSPPTHPQPTFPQPTYLPTANRLPSL